MTVSELIEALQKFDGNDIIRVEQEWGFEEITEIRKANEGRGVAIILDGEVMFLCPKCGVCSSGKAETAIALGIEL